MIPQCRLIPDAVMRNISGSMIGDDIQKAMTGAKGTPDASIAAIRGITPAAVGADFVACCDKYFGICIGAYHCANVATIEDGAGKPFRRI